MEIHLLPDLEEPIRREVEAGEYESVSALVIEALYRQRLAAEAG